MHPLYYHLSKNYDEQYADSNGKQEAGIALLADVLDKYNRFSRTAAWIIYKQSLFILASVGED